MEAKTAIAVFNQGSNESLNDAWERFKSMLRKCKGHGFDDLTQIHIFRNGLQPVHKTLLDATAGGSLMSKSVEEAITIIDRMALNDRQNQHDRIPSQRKSGVLELNTNDAILAQNKLLSQQVELLTHQMTKLPQQMKEIQGSQTRHHVAACELCNGDHSTGYQRQPPPHNNPYQRNNQGFQPSRFGNQHYQHQSPYQSSNPQRQGQQSQGGSSKLKDTLTQFMQASMANQRSNEAAIKNLENQVGQLAKQLSEQQPGASFSANTQTNPKEHCKAIFTRSGKEVNSGVNEEVIVEDEEEIIVENEGEKSEEKIEEELVEKERKEKEEREKNDKKVKKNKKRNENVSTIPLQHLPYPHVQSRKEDARRYARFMDIFKQLHINIPFSEALEKMPKYANFMKKMLTKKKKYTDEETVVLDAHCSAIIQKTPPRKEADPGRVILPITIGGNYISNDLVDLGFSINLIPLSVVKRLGNIEMKHTRITLQLADKSIISPYGVVQVMLVKVDKCLFPVDFVVVDMEEDRDVPLILGRPFMKTTRMMIDIDDGIMKVRVQDKEFCRFLCMREKATEEQFHFDPEIERTLRKLNSKTRRRRKLAQEKRQREEASTSSNNHIEEVVVDTFEGDMAGVVPTEMSANSPRRTAQFARNAQGGANTEMKTGILQLVYANPFTGMDHEDPFAHLTKFYEIAGSTGVDAANEESLFKRLFPHSLLGKAKEWYLDQLPNVMTDWNLLEEKILE
ncbi:uncharacterized protein LOC131635147 [Vicia villosa]|uniref:uncharacterized protein LOC131635147 n=1 Tax=Vicia villosa TaxID=3911 RepID=UPI00273A9F50|nr:uncharacterized protein LOC131635147 [Vicia villosa]